ncbi:MAG: patatin family protein [Eubacterium sp.]|nr:patatin family protein [Eubacterium sp.]
MSIGIVFEGGGLRGIFDAGVIDYLLDKGIVFDHVMGVSAGACHACSYVSGQRGRSYAVSTDYLDDPRYMSMESLAKTGDLFGVDFIYHKIPEELYPLDNEHFLKSGITFRAGVTNCVTGEAEYPQVKDLFRDVDLVRASSSLPLLARMVDIGGTPYMDGGIADSVPIKASEAFGCEKNVVVLTRPVGYRKEKEKMTRVVAMKYRKYPKMVDALRHRAETYNETMEYIDRGVADGTIFRIAPMGDLDIGRLEKDPAKLRKAYLEGYYVAEGLGKKLEEFLSAE